MPEYGYSIFLLLYSKIIFIRISDTIVNGFIVYRDSRITDNHRAVATLSYIGPSSLLSVVLTTQTQKGSMNIYMRNFDNSIPEDGTNVQIDVLLYSSILFKGIINPKSNISCDDIYFSSEARGFYVFYGLSLLDPPFTCDGVIINMKVDNDFGYQIYCGMNGKMYGRAKYVPNFTNWTEM